MTIGNIDPDPYNGGGGRPGDRSVSGYDASAATDIVLLQLSALSPPPAMITVGSEEYVRLVLYVIVCLYVRVSP